MDEYLFFQSHKKILGKQDDSFIGGMANQGNSSPDKTKQKFASTLKKLEEQYEEEKSLSPLKMKSKGSLSISKLSSETSVKSEGHEFTEETMKFGLDTKSEKYKDQYMSAGFPPKICTLFVQKLCSQNRLKCQILDVGCGKGFVGELLKADGFFRLSGIDCSKSLMQVARAKNVYEHLEQSVFGMDYTKIPEQHINKYDFVISASMINNDGFDSRVFKDLLKCLKLGGFVIFATKLNFAQENQYQNEIKSMTEEEYWVYTAEHSFYRYDKNADGSGKFSNKMVKILAFQKTDHDAWAEKKRIREEMEAKIEAEMKAAEEKKKKEREAKMEKASKAAKKK